MIEKTATCCVKLKSSSELIGIVDDFFTRSQFARKKRQQYANLFAAHKIATGMGLGGAFPLAENRIFLSACLYGRQAEVSRMLVPPPVGHRGLAAIADKQQTAV